ncbi:uncharacterized protein LOC124854974 isoform X2 [Hippoglossus stenolepis]|uniref:uncharacterized protein LOC124854974 isoform X2 n=1 Tax=Hippoglossus stenolepis TaxID=195615 RepID=UPI00181D43A2|nr:uncharacterized protein LOC124854974 isoform X2 [Hippoglossus stenolepis]
MPQRTQHCLVHVLLLWITVLSIMQVVFIIFYFTVERQRTTQIQPNNTPSFSSKHDLLGKGKMLTFQASGIYNKKVKWLAKNPDVRPLKATSGVLTIEEDGYYFLNLRVTLDSCEKEYTVALKCDNNTLLQVNTKLCSTGLLGKVEELSAGGTLELTINSEPNEDIHISESATHLDIIYMKIVREV